MRREVESMELWKRQLPPSTRLYKLSHPSFKTELKFYFLASSHPRSMAKKSRESVPHSWIAIATPSIIQRAGWSDGIPIGSSGGIPVRRLTFWIYVAVRFSLGGAHLLIHSRKSHDYCPRHDGLRSHTNRKSLCTTDRVPLWDPMTPSPVPPHYPSAPS